MTDVVAIYFLEMNMHRSERVVSRIGCFQIPGIATTASAWLSCA